ncbi:MAG: nucleotide exchange factor GrpE [Chloroflexi bacterium]|nr:nucleotide exchange factor GrpE [Chloroflexota bacterium]
MGIGRIFALGAAGIMTLAPALSEAVGEPVAAAESPSLQVVSIGQPSLTGIPDFIMAAMFVAAVLVISTWTVIVAGWGRVLFGGRSPEAVSPAKGSASVVPSLLQLTDNVSEISLLLGKAGTNLEKFKLDLEDHEAQSWKEKSESMGNYHRLVANLFLLLDHLDRLGRVGKASAEVQWTLQKTKQLLEDENIHEIPAKIGDGFDGVYHKAVDSRPDELPKGAIVEIARKGYYKMGHSREEDTVLRNAEVVVSSGVPR